MHEILCTHPSWLIKGTDMKEIYVDGSVKIIQHLIKVYLNVFYERSKNMVASRYPLKPFCIGSKSSNVFIFLLSPLIIPRAFNCILSFDCGNQIYTENWHNPNSLL